MLDAAIDILLQCLSITMLCRGFVEQTVVGQKIVADVEQSQIGVLIWDAVAGYRTFLGLAANEECIVGARIRRDFVSDGLGIVQPEELVDLVGRC